MWMSAIVVRLPLLVVKGEGPSLLGRNWLKELQLNWQQIYWVQNKPLEALLQKYQAVFSEGLGTCKGFKAKILVDPEAKPRFCKARSVPYFFRDKVEKELLRLVDEGTLEPVEHSEWATPIVSVLKSDKQSVRICGDFKQTINPVAKLDRHPIPKVEDLFANLAQGKTFTKLDLSQAYLQLPVDEESQKYLVINTHKGLFRYTRLPYGISSAPGIFQRFMENLLKDIPGVSVFIDDILITGETEEDHLKALEEVLHRLEKANLRAKRIKCKFMAPSVDYLGHRTDAEGLHPIKEKVSAITEAPEPKNVQELRSFLGLITYYSKFLRNMSTVLAPLYKLTRKVSLGTGQLKRRRLSRHRRIFSHLRICWCISTQICQYCWRVMHRHMEWAQCWPTECLMAQSGQSALHLVHCQLPSATMLKLKEKLWLVCLA